MADTAAFRNPAILLALALPVLAGSLYLRDSAATITGPLAIAADGDRVAVGAPGRVYRLDAEGTLLDVTEDAIAGDARDAGLAWVDGALFASPGPDNHLQRCDDDGCAPFSKDPYAPTGPVQIVYSGGLLWLAETEADRMHRFHVDGRRIDMPVSDLSTPGALLPAGDLLYVCNTGSGRIDRHTVHRRGVDYGELLVRANLGSEDDPVDRPLRLLAAGDGFRAIFTNAARTQGLLADVDADGGVTAITVPSLANPVAMAWLGNDLLVVDEELMQVVRLDADGNASLFGDDDFNAQLSAQRDTRSALRLAWPLLLGLAALLAAAGGSWLLHILSQRRGDPAQTVAQAADGIRWLPRVADRAGEYMTRNLLVAAPAALFPALATAWGGFMLPALAWVVLVALVAVAPAWRAAARARPPQDLRIGLRGRILVVTDTERGMREFPIGNVAWNNVQLQPDGKTLVALTRDGVDLFHRPTLDSVLFAALNPERRLPDTATDR